MPSSSRSSFCGQSNVSSISTRRPPCSFGGTSLVKTLSAAMDNTHFSERGRKPKVRTNPGVNITTEKDDDSSKLASPRLDLAQRLDRFITFIPAFAFVSNLQALWESVSASFQAGLINGGPTSLAYGRLFAWIGSLAIALSLAEMAYINPIVGAQYRWTSLYAPPGFMSPAFWGLLQGWITIFAWIATAASPAFLIGTIIQGLTLFFDTNYVFERWHGSLLAIAILCIPLVSSSLVY
jgi:choline transport protein